MNSAIAFKSFQIPVFISEGRPWVSVRHTCEALGVSIQGQQEKLRVSQEFSCQDILSTGPDGKNYQMLCIAAEHAHLWVAGISSAKVRHGIRDQFISYKHECANVIYNHFMQKSTDMFGIADQIQSLHVKLDSLLGISETVFGNDYPEIRDLISEAAKKFNMTPPEYWGRVRRYCDVSSYKLQNKKILEFIRSDLGFGVRVVK